jgi:hypothetical protein
VFVFHVCNCVYLYPQLLDAALTKDEHKVFIQEDVLRRFRGFGGVSCVNGVVVSLSAFLNPEQLRKIAIYPKSD